MLVWYFPSDCATGIFSILRRTFRNSAYHWAESLYVSSPTRLWAVLWTHRPAIWPLKYTTILNLLINNCFEALPISAKLTNPVCLSSIISNNVRIAFTKGLGRLSKVDVIFTVFNPSAEPWTKVLYSVNTLVNQKHNTFTYILWT